MRFGLLTANQYPPDHDPVRRFQDLVEQARLGRELGFDAYVFGQHFLPTQFQMLQPVPVVARLAAESGPMRLGITIFLLPLLNPVDIAEQAATLDVICGGRFIFGVGLGYREVEDRAFGLGQGERAGRLIENLDVIRRLWRGEAVSFDRPYCRLREARLTLRPVQRPHPPVWVAANNDAAVERAATIGDTWVINPHAKLATIARQVGLYRAALERAGKPFPAELPMMRELFVAEDRATAIRTVRPYLERKYQAYVEWGQHKVLPRGDDLSTPFDELIQDRFILGSPAECAAEIQRCVDATGANTMLFRVQWPGMDQATVVKTIRLLGEKVRPLVKG